MTCQCCEKKITESGKRVVMRVSVCKECFEWYKRFSKDEVCSSSKVN